MKWKKTFMTKAELQKYVDEINKHKYQCRCGKKVYIDRTKEKAVCDWCGRYVFKNKSDEFRYRMKEVLKNERRYQDNSRETNEQPRKIR